MFTFFNVGQGESNVSIEWSSANISWVKSYDGAVGLFYVECCSTWTTNITQVSELWPAEFSTPTSNLHDIYLSPYNDSEHLVMCHRISPFFCSKWLILAVFVTCGNIRWHVPSASTITHHVPIILRCHGAPCHSSRPSHDLLQFTQIYPHIVSNRQQLLPQVRMNNGTCPGHEKSVSQSSRNHQCYRIFCYYALLPHMHKYSRLERET